MEYRGLPAFRFGAIIFHQYGEVNHASQPRLTQTFLNFSFSDGAASYPKLHSFFFFGLETKTSKENIVILLQTSNVFNIQQIYNS